MAKDVTIYAVPEAIASALHLTRIRVNDDKGFYLLSASDLRPYGITRALAEGAVIMTSKEARARFFSKS